MPEQELKLHVPAASRQAVQREIKQREATRIRLHAMYFDTPERELARARIAIRLRLEGRDWVQTLKMPGADPRSSPSAATRWRSWRTTGEVDAAAGDVIRRAAPRPSPGSGRHAARPRSSCART